MRWLVTCAAALGVGALDRYGARGGLHADDIVAVRPGMTMDEVTAILGAPVRKEVRRDYKFFCRCNPENVCYRSYRTTWVYTRKPLTRFLPYPAYPMLWVHFNSRDRVDEVYAKEYFSLDRRGVYLTKLDPCDTTDRTIERQPPGYDETKALQGLRKHF